MNGTPSRIQATAKTVDGETSSWPFPMAFRRLSEVSLTPGRMSAKRSVLAVHWTMTLSKAFLALKSLSYVSVCSHKLGQCCLPDILSDVFNMVHAGLASRDQVIGTVFLVSGNKVGIVDARKRNHRGHFFFDLGLESWFENRSPVHCIGQVQATDIPTTKDEVIGVDHGQDIMEWDVHILRGLCIGAELHSRSHDNRAVVISSTRTLTSFPNKAPAISNDTGSNRGTVVSTPAHQHHAGLGYLAVDFEVIDRLLWSSYILTIGGLFDHGGTISVLGSYLALRIDDIGRVNCEEVLVGGGRRTISVREARSIFSVRCHAEVVFGWLDGGRVWWL
jgi:hypothetical protein